MNDTTTLKITDGCPDMSPYVEALDTDSDGIRDTIDQMFFTMYEENKRQRLP